MNYKTFGIKEFYIPRSSGEISKGNVNKNRYECIKVESDNIFFPVEFFEKQLYEKRINLKDSVDINFHFPLFQITRDQLDVSNINKKLKNLCILNNDALKLFLAGKKDSETFISILPWELICHIIYCYYTEII